MCPVTWPADQPALRSAHQAAPNDLEPLVEVKARRARNDALLDGAVAALVVADRLVVVARIRRILPPALEAVLAAVVDLEAAALRRLLLASRRRVAVAYEVKAVEGGEQQG